MSRPKDYDPSKNPLVIAQGGAAGFGGFGSAQLAVAGGRASKEALFPAGTLSRFLEPTRVIPLAYLEHTHSLNSVSGLVPKVWFRIPFDQSELSISVIPPTD